MTPDQMRDASLLELFRMEAEAQKQVLDTGLLILERDPLNAGQLEACMRAAHSLKGASRIVGLDSGVKVAHAMEDLLVAAQEGLLRLLPDHIDALLQGSDLLLQIGQAQPETEPHRQGDHQGIGGDQQHRTAGLAVGIEERAGDLQLACGIEPVQPLDMRRTRFHPKVQVSGLVGADDGKQHLVSP